MAKLVNLVNLDKSMTNTVKDISVQVDAQIYEKLISKTIHNFFEKTIVNPPCPSPSNAQTPPFHQTHMFQVQKKNCVVFLCFYCGQPNNKNTSDYIQIEFYVDFRTQDRLCLSIFYICTYNFMDKNVTEYVVGYLIYYSTSQKYEIGAQKNLFLSIKCFSCFCEKVLYFQFWYRLFFLRSIAQFFTEIYMNCFVSS